MNFNQPTLAETQFIHIQSENVSCRKLFNGSTYTGTCGNKVVENFKGYQPISGLTALSRVVYELEAKQCFTSFVIQCSGPCVDFQFRALVNCFNSTKMTTIVHPTLQYNTIDKCFKSTFYDYVASS